MPNDGSAAAAAALSAASSIYASNKAAKGAQAQIDMTKAINDKRLNFQKTMWNATNFYNTPQAQMQRFIKAGLNPNLIYGRGSSGNASNVTVPSLDVPDVAAKYNARAEMPANFLGMAQVAATAGLTLERKKNVKQDTANKAIEGTIKAVKAASSALNYKQQQALYDTVIQTAKSNLERVNQDIDIRGNVDTRQERVVNATVSKIGQEISNLKKKGQILSSEAVIKRIDKQLYEKYRMRPNDPFYMRYFTEIFETIKSQYFGKQFKN